MSLNSGLLKLNGKIYDISTANAVWSSRNLAYSDYFAKDTPVVITYTGSTTQYNLGNPLELRVGYQDKNGNIICVYRDLFVQGYNAGSYTFSRCSGGGYFVIPAGCRAVVEAYTTSSDPGSGTAGIRSSIPMTLA